MKHNFVVNAEARQDEGKGASRRLRREGKVPAVLYGGNSAAESLAVSANELKNNLKVEAFYSAIITLSINGSQQQVVLKDLQRHPARSDEILHLDLYRILADKLLRRNVPLHFTGSDVAPGVKLEGGMLEHLMNEVEVECLPKDLPEYIEVNVSEMKINDTLHLAQLALPAGVKAVALERGGDPAVASCHTIVVEEEAAVAPAAADVPAANQKAPAVDAKAAPAKKDEKKK
jgi:large subunit ribosomal protein L25